VKDKIFAWRHRIKSIEEMEVALQQEWAKIKLETLKKLMESMPWKIN
jgi:hypothetical protein